MSDLKARLLDMHESVSVYTDASMCLRAWSPDELKQLGQEAHDMIEYLEKRVKLQDEHINKNYQRIEWLRAEKERLRKKLEVTEKAINDIMRGRVKDE